MTITTMKKLFASGLLLQITAQVLFSVHSDKINLMEPIDFIHWMILIGTVLIAPLCVGLFQWILPKYW